MVSTSQIRRVIVSEVGGPDVLRVEQVPAPEPGPGQLLVRVAASGLNFIDVYRRTGLYPTPTPFGLGTECAGEVVSLGAGVDGAVNGFAVGDLVATESGTATHADLAIIEAARAVPVPAGVPAEVAAGAMLQGITAQYLCTSTYPVREGEEAIVHAAAGGVGQLLVQLLVARGVRVVATAGSAAKADIATALGAAAVVRYDELDSSDELAGALRAATLSGRAHVAFDGVGAATFDASLASLHPRGMMVLFGAASGPVPPFDLQRLNSGGSLYVTRPTLAHYVATTEELRARAADVLGAIAAGTLTVHIGGRYALEDAADAYRDLEGRRSTGKLLLIP